jgi:molecular chaperone HscB
MNYFAAFDLTPSFALDLKTLAARYRDLQAAVHPDRFVNATDAEKRVAMERTLQVNDAYVTLNDPVKRAMYLLSLVGVDGMDSKDTSMPHAFLIEQMQWRESIADAKIKEDVERLEEMGTELQSMLASLGDTFAAAYDGGHHTVATTLARKMRFTQKLIEEVDQNIGALDN